MVVVSAQQIDDRMRIGAGRQSCNRPCEACTYDVRDVRWMDVFCVMNHTTGEMLVGIGGWGLRGPCSHTRMTSAHFPSTAHRRASAQARRPPRTNVICSRRTGQ